MPEALAASTQKRASAARSQAMRVLVALDCCIQLTEGDAVTRPAISDLAGELGLNVGQAGSLSGRLLDLEERGLVHRHGRRGRLQFRLTEAGSRLVRATTPTKCITELYPFELNDLTAEDRARVDALKTEIFSGRLDIYGSDHLNRAEEIQAEMDQCLHLAKRAYLVELLDQGVDLETLRAAR